MWSVRTSQHRLADPQPEPGSLLAFQRIATCLAPSTDLNTALSKTAPRSSSLFTEKYSCQGGGSLKSGLFLCVTVKLELQPDRLCLYTIPQEVYYRPSTVLGKAKVIPSLLPNLFTTSDWNKFKAVFYLIVGIKLVSGSMLIKTPKFLSWMEFNLFPTLYRCPLSLYA